MRNKQSQTNDSKFQEKYNYCGQEKLFKFIDIDTLMRETQYFNNDNLRENYSRIILMKLIYFFNQGLIIDVLTMELLYFRIIKLFKLDSTNLKRMAYKILKMIIDQKFEFMLLSCLKKDITSKDKYLRLNALRMVPYLTDVQNIVELQKYVQMGVMDQCKQIQSTALILGLNIYQKFPNIMCSCFHEIKDSLQENNVHSLLLLYKIQTDKNLFLKTLIQIIQYKLQPHFIMNVLRFIQEILFVHKQLPHLKFYKKELVQYLFLQITSNDDLIFFEVFKIFMRMIKQLPEEFLMSLVNILCSYLRPKVDNISQYTSLTILKKLSNLTDINNLANNKLLEQLEDSLIYSRHAEISANSLFLCMKINNELNSSYLEKIYMKTNDLREQINFLQGLIEFSDVFHILGGEILKFIKIIITNDSSEELIKQAFKIIKYFLKDANQQFYLKSIHTLFSIAAKCNNKYQFKVVRLIHKEFDLTPNKKINKQDVYNQFLGFQDLFSKIQNYTITDNITKFNNDSDSIVPQMIIKNKEKNRIYNKTFQEGDIFDDQNQKETMNLLDKD